MLKRLFDVIFSVIILVILCPVFIIIALLIKLDSKGPVFFRQMRVGKHGMLFRIYKFRTMKHSIADKGLQITVADDDRITHIGYFLRKYKLDELAQFLNVLFGQMSVVGPRPEVPDYVDKYPESLRDKILSVRPGITDKASIEFRNENDMLDGCENQEETYINKILPIKLKYYSDYIDSHTFFGDMVIIWHTITVIMKD